MKRWWNCKDISLTHLSDDLKKNSVSYLVSLQSCATFEFFFYLQFELICDRDWISSTITTIQMAGLLVSSPVAGQMADSLGRKPAFFLSLLVLTVCNLIAAFSVSWEMFAACRFLIGFGCGMYLTTFYSFMQEFVPTNWRSMTAAVPAWAIFAALYGFFSWWLHDWKYLHYATAIVTAPFLLGILYVSALSWC